MPSKQNMIFNVDGVHVNSDHVCNDKFCTIHLDNLSNNSTGSYRCEISGDAPAFLLSHETSNMTVAGEYLLRLKALAFIVIAVQLHEITCKLQHAQSSSLQLLLCC